jgi:16S rRNA (guanine527-N7)-methyltransferase
MAADLRDVLGDARRLGFVGGDDLEAHLRHAEAFAAVIEELGEPGQGLDLGSGGGLPGLVLAARWPAARWWLVDAGQRRAAFLSDAVVRLGWEGRVTVLGDRAETLARSIELRAQLDVVSARAFGPPGVTSECGAGFLRVGGHLVVSEPPSPPVEPTATERWAVDGLDQLGLRSVEMAGRVPPEPHFHVLEQVRLCPDRYPRRVGIPTKRPLF